MLPSLLSFDSRDSATRYSITLCDLSMWSIGMANSQGVSSSDFREPVSFSAILPRQVHFPKLVFFMRSYVEMRRIAAASVRHILWAITLIARMQHEWLVIGRMTERENECESMRKKVPLKDSRASVSIVGQAALPEPAVVWTPFVDTAPKEVYRIFRGTLLSSHTLTSIKGAVRTGLGCPALSGPFYFSMGGA